MEFVILTVGGAPHGIRFIQTCPLPDREDVTVELSLEEGKSRSRLVEKDCSMEECIVRLPDNRKGGIQSHQDFGNLPAGVPHQQAGVRICPAP